ncbi:hypothetical protein PC121_g11881 [Phytophthora cactorum]|nr:hypothetical protein PC120_g5453 [Phytophthora cactorum]KAG3064050.1 hypothetical protein PC121_g11881 [Phytophthora cactorum]KAG4054288.1 hypothetical protein PC123_g10587 [Phytophthora cactorum]
MRKSPPPIKMSTGPIVVKIFTIRTVMMRFSLVLDFVRMRKQSSTGDMSVMPPVMLFTNCFTSSFYSYVIEDIAPLFVTSVLGVVVGGVLTCLFYCWASNKTESVQVIIVAVFVCVVMTIYGALAVTGVTGQSHSSVSTTLGFITIAATIVLYASPMATVIRVLQTKTASSMPYTMGVVNVLNSLGWILNSSLVDNMFMLAPNIGGIILGTSLHTSIRTRHELTRRVRRCRLKMSTALQNSLLLPSRTKKTAKNGASRLITPAVLVLLRYSHQFVKLRKINCAAGAKRYQAKHHTR